MRSPKENHIASLKKATIEVVLLKLLTESDMYGYQISQELKKRSAGKYKILEGSMYPILYRLQERGCITCYDKRIGTRQTRVYYHLEEEGKRYYQESLATYREYLDIIDFILNSEMGAVYEEA